MKQRIFPAILSSGYILLVFATAACTSSRAYDNWYPASIDPAPGHQYPCALTALPLSLSGIPESDKQYINHTYSMILKCLQAKMIMLDTLNSNEQSSYSRAFKLYESESSAARQKLISEPCPSGLEPFRDDVAQAVEKQISFFKTATKMRESGESMRRVMAQPDGQAASGLLQSAWGKMAARYPGWSNEVKDSIYHHLCALDLF